MASTPTKRWHPRKYDPPTPPPPHVADAEKQLAASVARLDRLRTEADRALDQRDDDMRHALEVGSSLKRCARIAKVSKAMVARIRDRQRASTSIPTG